MEKMVRVEKCLIKLIAGILGYVSQNADLYSLDDA